MATSRNRGREASTRRRQQKAAARCAAAERLLRQAAEAQGMAIKGQELLDAWQSSAVRDLRLGHDRNWSHILGPAIEAGRVATRRIRGSLYLAPATDGAPAFPFPLIGVAAVEEATRRLVAEHEGAVSPLMIEQYARQAPDLNADLPQSVAMSLNYLTRHDRLLAVTPPYRPAGWRLYFTFPGGPKRIARAAEHPKDVRLRIVWTFWRQRQRQPFTTRAARLYAERQLRNVPGWDVGFVNWGNELAGWEACGILEMLPVALPGSQRLWTFRMSEGIHTQGSVPTRRSTSAKPASSELRRATAPARPTSIAPYDMSEVSRSRLLVEWAINDRSAGESDPERADVLRMRGAAAEDIGLAVMRHPLLAPRSKDRSRVWVNLRHAMRRVDHPVVSYGSVGGVTWYDTERRDSAEQWVAYLRIADAVRREALFSLVQAYAEGAGKDALCRTPPSVQAARTASLTQRLAICARALKEAGSRARFLPEEGAAHAALLEALQTADLALQTLARQAEGVAPDAGHPARGQREGAGSPPSDGSPTGPQLVLDTGHWPRDLLPVSLAGPLLGHIRKTRRTAAKAIQDIAQVRMLPLATSPHHLARAFPDGELVVDRVEFACRMLIRLGSGRIAVAARRANYLLGDLRNGGTIGRALLDPQWQSSHHFLAAALGFLDDPESRRALVTYLGLCLMAAPVRRASTTPAGCDAAILALAPLALGGLAKTLRPDERAVLEGLRDRSDRDDSRRLCGMVIQAWDEHWEPARLARL